MDSGTHSGRMSSRTAIIIGGGIAGPAVALFLDRAGVRSQIFEAYPPSDGVGGGFQIAPNGMRVLAALGLADAVAAHGHPADGFSFWNHRGRLLGRMQTDRSGKAITTMRAPFYRVLVDAVERARIPIHHGKRVVDLADDGDAIVARFADGSSVRGDFVVGADGVHSPIRALVAPDHAASRYTGLLGIGGLTQATPVDLDPRTVSTLNFVLGPRLSFGYSVMGATGRWGWWSHIPADREPTRDELRAFVADGGARTRLLELFGGWCPPIGPMLETSTSILCTPIHDVPSLPAWSRGRAVLIGDAAHAMSPAAGQGASLALEDAMQLAGAVADPATPLADAFASFEASRRARAEPIAKLARDNDQRALKQLGAFGCWMRDRMFPLFAPMISRGLDKQYAAGPA